MDTVTRVQILDLPFAKTLGKDMNPIMLSPALGRQRTSALIKQPIKQKEN